MLFELEAFLKAPRARSQGSTVATKGGTDVHEDVPGQISGEGLLFRGDVAFDFSSMISTELAGKT
jgi:hypothetical protein